MLSTTVTTLEKIHNLPAIVFRAVIYSAYELMHERSGQTIINYQQLPDKERAKIPYAIFFSYVSFAQKHNIFKDQ